MAAGGHITSPERMFWTIYLSRLGAVIVRQGFFFFVSPHISS